MRCPLPPRNIGPAPSARSAKGRDVGQPADLRQQREENEEQGMTEEPGGLAHGLRSLIAKAKD
jgi:hypothetical protein